MIARLTCMLLCGLANSFASGDHGSKESAIRRRIESTRIAEMQFGGTLPDVATHLASLVKKLQPGNEELSIFVRTNAMPTSSSPALNLSNAYVHQTFPIYDVTLREALDVILKTCDTPIKYLVTENGIVFEPDPDHRSIEPPLETPSANSKAAKWRLKLRQTEIPKIDQDFVMLDELVSVLIEHVERTVNFVIACEKDDAVSPSQPGYSSYSVLVDAAGNPVRSPIPFIPDCFPVIPTIKQAAAELERPFGRTNALAALDTFVKLADLPIRYSMEDYGVLIELIDRRVGWTKLRIPEIQIEESTLVEAFAALRQQTDRLKVPISYSSKRTSKPVAHTDLTKVYLPGETLGWSEAWEVERCFVDQTTVRTERLENASLKTVLTAIVEGADWPIRYSLSPLFIVFELDLPTNDSLVPQVFKVAAPTITARLGSASSRSRPPRPSDASRHWARRLRTHLFAAGIEAMSPNNPDCRVYFNTNRGYILILSPPEDVSSIEAVIRRLHTP